MHAQPRCPGFVVVLALLLGFASHAPGGKDGPPVARTRSALGTIWSVGATETAPLSLHADITAGMRLLTPPGERGALEVKEGDLRVTLVGSLPQVWPGRTLETVVTLGQPKGDDLALTLDRGIVLLETTKTSEARTRIDIQGKTIKIDLRNASAVALELSSRWPEGSPFLKEAKPDHAPLGVLWLSVLRGKVELTLETERQVLTGPLAYRWTSRGVVEGPLALKGPPDWATPEKISDKAALNVLQANEKLRLLAAKNPSAWREALAGKDASLRRVAVYHAAARDQVGAVVDALNGDADRDVRQAALTALRHFSGRSVAQEKVLHDTLIERKFKPGQAQILMHLLHGFNVEARNRPETYESLISYLQHEQMAIRELAATELVALAPAGKEIAYDAAAPATARAAAQAAWRKLIPEGSVPKSK